MTVLRYGISAHTTVVTVDAPLSNPSYPIFYDLDSETIKVTDGADTPDWQVERGVANTQAAKHAKNVRLVANASPYGGGGGGGVSVDNGVDPPATVTTINAAGAQISGSTATLGQRPVVVSEDDPGTIGAGNLWVRLDPDQSHAPMLYVRNETDDGWVDDDNAGYGLGLTYYDGPEVSASIFGTVGQLQMKVEGGARVQIDASAVVIAGPASSAIVQNERNVVTLNPTLTNGGSIVILHRDALDTTDKVILTLSDTGVALGGEAANLTASGVSAGTQFVLQGDNFGRAAHVANGSTVDQLRDALIASGLMAAS